jgi:serpin B
VVLIGVIWGAWAYVHRKPDAIPATKPVRNSISQFAYASAAQYLSDDGLLNKQGNSNYSPASMWMALSMAMQGAGGETKTEMTQILNANKELSDKDYQSLMLSINGKYDGKSEMDTHNSLWIDKQYTPGAEFKKSLQSRFDAETISADYSNDAANKMSKWIEKNTKGMLKPDIKIDEYERLSLINTVYADGHWSKPFMESDTQDATFHGSQGDSKVAMMEQSACMDAVVGQGWQRVDKKFDNGGMLKIVLPDQGALDVFVKSPDVLHLLFSQEAGKSTVNLKMPRFTIENTFQSEETKKAMEKLGFTERSIKTKLISEK